MPKKLSVEDALGLRAKLVADAAEKDFVIDVHAVRELDAGLNEAMAYRDILDDDPFRDRHVAALALRAFIQFLRAHPRWRAPAIPMGQLQAALLDLNRGHQAVMLRPAPVEHGRPVSLYDTRLRGYAAGIMGGLMEHGHMPRPKAAEWVATRLGDAGHDVAADTVTDWRKDALHHKRSPDLHRAYRAAYRATAWKKAPLECAEQLVMNLIRLYPQKGE